MTPDQALLHVKGTGADRSPVGDLFKDDETRLSGVRMISLFLLAAGLAIAGGVDQWSLSTPPALAQQPSAEDGMLIAPVLPELEAAAVTPPERADGTVETGIAEQTALDDDRISRLNELIETHCDVRPLAITAEDVALTIKLQLGSEQQTCLDEVALHFDRDHPTAPKLMFDLLAAKVERQAPVLQISTIHTGSLPYIHLHDGRTLFVGSIVEGWELSSIDQEGAEFRQGDRIFRLAINGDGDAL